MFHVTFRVFVPSKTDDSAAIFLNNRQPGFVRQFRNPYQETPDVGINDSGRIQYRGAERIHRKIRSGSENLQSRARLAEVKHRTIYLFPVEGKGMRQIVIYTILFDKAVHPFGLGFNRHISDPV